MTRDILLDVPSHTRVSSWSRAGLCGGYFFGMSGIGFCLPFLPTYLKEEKGFSDRDIAFVWVLSAVSGLLQFPLGLWSDRVGRRKPFLVVLLAILAVATLLLPMATPGGWGSALLGLLVMLFAENGACRASVESLAGAEATQRAEKGKVGAALGSLRFWRPVGVVLTAILGGILADDFGVRSLLGPLAVLQGLAVLFALFIRERPDRAQESETDAKEPAPFSGSKLRDPALWAFISAMVLFHLANAPPGAYLGLFLKQHLASPAHHLALAFVISMTTWLIVVRPCGWLTDRFGRKPLLLVGWGAMAVRLILLSLARESWQVLLIQILDGIAQGIFAVAAAAWVTGRLADPRRAGQGQVIVGTSLVFGSALGPALAGLVVEDMGYRETFTLLAGVGIVATLIVLFLVPETSLPDPRRAEG